MKGKMASRWNIHKDKLQSQVLCLIYPLKDKVDLGCLCNSYLFHLVYKPWFSSGFQPSLFPHESGRSWCIYAIWAGPLAAKVGSLQVSSQFCAWGVRGCLLQGFWKFSFLLSFLSWRCLLQQRWVVLHFPVPLCLRQPSCNDQENSLRWAQHRGPQSRGLEGAWILRLSWAADLTGTELGSSFKLRWCISFSPRWMEFSVACSKRHTATPAPPKMAISWPQIPVCSRKAE